MYTHRRLAPVATALHADFPHNKPAGLSVGSCQYCIACMLLRVFYDLYPIEGSGVRPCIRSASSGVTSRIATTEQNGPFAFTSKYAFRRYQCEREVTQCRFCCQFLNWLPSREHARPYIILWWNSSAEKVYYAVCEHSFTSTPCTLSIRNRSYPFTHFSEYYIRGWLCSLQLGISNWKTHLRNPSSQWWNCIFRPKS